jgi:hypothetical protein
VCSRRTSLVVVTAVVILTGAGRRAGAAAAGASETAGTCATAQPPGTQTPIVNPYAPVVWEKVEFLHSFSHEHGGDPQVFWDMGFGHLPLSNYYPSRPFYPLPDAFAKKHPAALGAPNAEHHSTTDSGFHFCTLGSLYTIGYGQTPRIKAGTAPIEHVFSGLNVFDAGNSPWLGVYRLDLRMAAPAGSDREPAVSLTVEGATQISHKTFAPVGDGNVRGRRLTAKSPEAMYLKTKSGAVRVRLVFAQVTGMTPTAYRRQVSVQGS